MKTTQEPISDIKKLNTKVYFLRVSGRNHAGVKQLAKELGITMDKLSDMLIEDSIKKVRSDNGLSIKVRRLKDGSADMQIQ